MAAPTFHGIVAVDIEGFGPRRTPIQASLRKSMYEVLEEACADAHIGWSDLTVADRDSGAMLLIPATVSMVHIAGSLVRALDENLKEKATIFSDAHRLRLRVALHQGLCQRDATGWVG